MAILCSAPVDARRPSWVAIDGQTLARGRAIYNIAGVSTSPLAAWCNRADTSRYRCGVDARTALKRMIARRPVICLPLEGQKGDFVCKAGAHDLGAQIVREGHGVATIKRFAAEFDPGSIDYRPQQAIAKAAKRGIWQGRFVDPPTLRPGSGVRHVPLIDSSKAG